MNFHRRKQQDGEKFDAFVTDLKNLVKDCGYTDRMIRDVIVCHAWHSRVREKCLNKGDELTLDIAISIGQNHETSQESLKIISKEEDSKVHSVKKRTKEEIQENLNPDALQLIGRNRGMGKAAKVPNQVTNYGTSVDIAQHIVSAQLKTNDAASVTS